MFGVCSVVGFSSLGCDSAESFGLDLKVRHVRDNCQKGECSDSGSDAVHHYWFSCSVMLNCEWDISKRCTLSNVGARLLALVSIVLLCLVVISAVCKREERVLHVKQVEIKIVCSKKISDIKGSWFCAWAWINS
jgi:hypothetical protein